MLGLKACNHGFYQSLVLSPTQVSLALKELHIYSDMAYNEHLTDQNMAIRFALRCIMILSTFILSLRAALNQLNLVIIGIQDKCDDCRASLHRTSLSLDSISQGFNLFTLSMVRRM